MDQTQVSDFSLQLHTCTQNKYKLSKYLLPRFHLQYFFFWKNISISNLYKEMYFYICPWTIISLIKLAHDLFIKI